MQRAAQGLTLRALCGRLPDIDVDRTMMKLDQRFALVRDGARWFAAEIAGTYRVSKRGLTRDAYDQSLKETDLEIVAKLVINEGMRIRCSPGGQAASSLDLQSRGVTGYQLDPQIASRLGVPPRTS